MGDPIEETKMTNADFADIEAIVGGYHGAPHKILGMHETTVDEKACIVVRAFRPLDERVFVLDVKNERQFEMEQVHEGGFFELVFARRRNLFQYRLVLHGKDGSVNEIEDAYAFPFLLTEFDLHLHGEGTFTQSYAKLGAQMCTAQRADRERGGRGQLCRVGAQCPAGGGDRSLQRLGSPHARHDPAGRGHLGDLHPQPGPEYPIQIFDQVNGHGL